MWWKKNKWRVIVPVLAAIVLAAAFWFGGSAPGLQGWTVDNPDPQTAAPAVQTTQTPVSENSARPASPVSAPPEASPENAPEPTPAPSPEGSPEPAPTESPGTVPEPTATPAPAPEVPLPAETMVLDPNTGKDQYNTDPVPEGRPLPVEPQDAQITDTAYTCTISISCATILDNLDWLNPEKAELVPEDGVILAPSSVTFYEGESVFNVLQRTCKQNRIHMEFSETPMYNSAYIEGIHNLYEFDCGEQSGWMYSVNCWFPNYGCSRYQLQDGDVIAFVYTCDLGADVGNRFQG